MLQKLNNLKEELAIALLFIVTRLPGLGFDVFNTDVWKWKARIFDFGPGVSLMWLGTIGVKLQTFYYEFILGYPVPDNEISSVISLHFFQKLVIACFLALIFAFIFYFVKRIFNKTISFLVVIIMMFEPFFLAISRTVHLEALLTIFLIGSFLSFYLYIDNKEKKFYYLSAIFAAFAVLTKTSGAFIGGFVLLSYIFYYKNTQFIKEFIIWCLITLGVFILAWPAIWVAPLEVVNALYRGIFTIGVERGHELCKI
jgi:hypothetical protein